MLSMKLEEVSSPRGSFGSHADMVSIGAMAKDDLVGGNSGAGLAFKTNLGALLGALAANERTYTCAA